MRLLRAAYIPTASLAAGGLAFWLTGAFHWTYLAAVFTGLGLFLHAARAPAKPMVPSPPTDRVGPAERAAKPNAAADRPRLSTQSP